MFDQLRLLWYRLVSGSALPARWIHGDVLQDVEMQARSGRLHIEIVSHCWGYSHMMAYQLSSLLQYTPQNVDITMTMYYCKEDADTVRVLEFFAQQEIANIRWNWQALEKQQLFRRAIGREQASRASKADWIWFADCDLIFGQGCLDGLAAVLQGADDVLVFPGQEMISGLLADDHPMLAKDQEPRIKGIDPELFVLAPRARATGAFQIVHGDVARAIGYCGQLAYFMQPVDHWAKTYEDTAFRWLINNQGRAIEMQSLYRIRHQSKGRYRGRALGKLRGEIRRAQDKNA
ncbi:MAG: glycosyltransferase family 2 protein [Oceanococcus sp.]